MLCTSILSEVILGFMMWSGWLGAMPASDAAHAEYYVPSQNLAIYGTPPTTPPVGTACPQACVACPMPMYYPQAASVCPLDGNAVEVCKILSLPRHLAACNLRAVTNLDASTVKPCDRPCSWKIQSVVKQQTASGVEVDITLDADYGGVKETYKATKVLAFDAVTDVTLEGANPEPVCLRVAARRPAQPVVPVNDIAWGGHVWSLPAPIAYAPPMPPPFITQAAPPRIPEPLPVWPPQAEGLPCASIMPASLTLPAPTPVHHASVKLVYEAGKPRLCVKSEGMTTECLRMKLERGVAGAVRLSAGKNRVHLTGNKWKAEADRVELDDDGRVVLAGHVKLTSDKLGVCAAVKAERLCVEVKAGKFEKIVDSK